MLIATDTVVRLRYRITDPQDEVLDDGDSPLEYLQGHGEFFPPIESALAGQGVGFEQTFHLEPEDAFGDYDADLVHVVPRDRLPDGIEPGMQFEGLPDDDPHDAPIYTVTDVTDEVVVLDGNHPLAGRALRVWVKVEGVRPATEDELSAGHTSSINGMSVIDANGSPRLQ